MQLVEEHSLSQDAERLPRVPDVAWIESVVANCSHGVGTGFDPTRQMGCQRESLSDLGFGWIYFALGRTFDINQALVVGSGRGFSVACLGAGLESGGDAIVHLVDPGLQEWSVDGSATDRGEGLWRTAYQAADYLRRHAGIRNVRLHRLRSDEAFAEFRRERRRFDLILIDGDHGFEQCARDLRHAAECLAPHGLLLAHDACCPEWPGVSLALEVFLMEHPEFQQVTTMLYPGLAVLQRRQSLVSIRHVTADENDLINEWRSAGGVTPRPVAGLGDPRPGEVGPDPREGLFGIFENERLVGGFGIRRRLFRHDGSDDFVPHAGGLLAGFLLYGAVIEPSLRGRGRFQIALCRLLQSFGDEGLYEITRNPPSRANLPYEQCEAGQATGYTAYHLRPRRVPRGEDLLRSPDGAEATVRSGGPQDADLIRELDRAEQRLAQNSFEMNAANQQIGDLIQQVAELQQALGDLQTVREEQAALLRSRSWRLTAPCRHAAAMVRRLMRRA